MSTPAERFAELDRRYRGRYAGQPRATRDREALVEMVGELKGLREEVDDSDTAGKTLVENIDTTLATWTKEIDAITEAQQAGKGSLALQSAGQWLGEVRGRYLRNFAGKSRDTRDLGILGEMIDEVNWIGTMVANVPGDAPTDEADEVSQNVTQIRDLLTSERERITEARGSGDASQRAQRWATLANNQFSRYRLHMAGQPRVSRSPRLIRSIVDELKRVHGGMKAISGGGDAHKKNIRLVGERIEQFSSEIDAIGEAVAQATGPERALALGDAANKVFQAYRDEFAGKPRTEVTTERLNELWELLWPVTRELAGLEYTGEAAQKNLTVCRDMLRSLQREYDAIVDAQKGS